MFFELDEWIETPAGTLVPESEIRTAQRMTNMHWWITETSWTLEMAGTSEKRAQMLNEWIGLELKYAEEYLSYEFHRQKVKELTERTAAEIRQRERANRDFERDEKAADLAQTKDSRFG